MKKLELNEMVATEGGAMSVDCGLALASYGITAVAMIASGPVGWGLMSLALAGGLVSAASVAYSC